MQHYTKTIEYTGVTFEDVAEFGKHEGNTFTFMDIVFNKETEDTFLFKRAGRAISWAIFKRGMLLLIGSDDTLTVIGVNEVESYGYKTYCYTRCNTTAEEVKKSPDWVCIEYSPHGCFYEKKDGSAIVVGTWDGKGTKYDVHFKNKSLVV